MAVRFRDTATGELLEADTPELEAEAAATPGLQRYDLQSPILFKDKKTGDVFGATDLGLAEEAEKDAGLRRLTQEEYAQHYQQQVAEERKAVEAAAGQKYLAEHPVRGAIGAGLLGLVRSTLPVVGPAITERMGLPLEEQAAVTEAFPVSAGVGTAAGIAGQLAAGFATGGLSAAAGAAGKAAATEAAAAGAGRVAQALAAARAASGIAPTAVEAVAPGIAAGARVGLATEAALKSLAPKAAETIIGKGLVGATGAAAAAGLSSALTEAAESYVEGREFSGESVLATMGLAGKLGGAFTAIPAAVSGAANFFGKTEAGKQFAAKLGRTRAERIYNKHAPDILAKTSQQISYPQTVELVNEAAERGLVGEFMDANRMSEKAREAMQESGQRLRNIAEMADDKLGKPINVGKMWDKMVDTVIAPKSAAGTVESETVARKLADQIQSMRDETRGGGDNITLKRLWDFRKEIDDKVYGFSRSTLKDPNRTEFYNSMRQFRHLMTDAMGDAVAEAGIPKAIWKAAQRDYQIASHAERIAQKSLVSSANKSGLDLPDFLLKAASLGTGVLTGSALAGIETAIGLSTLKAVAPRAREWGNAAMQRALRTGTSRLIAEDIGALSRQQAEMAESLGGMIDVKPEEAAVNQYFALLDDINQAIESPLPASYRKTLLKARDEMQRAHGAAKKFGPGLVAPRAFTIPGEEPGFLGFDVNELGNGVEKARNIIEAGSVPTRLAVKTPRTASFIGAQQRAYETMRGLRDGMTAALANPQSMWGEQRATRAVEELRRLYAVHTDPARIAKIQSLQEAANKVRQTVQQKGSRLMGVSASVAPLNMKLNRVFDPLQAEAIKRMEHTVEPGEPSMEVAP